MKKTYMTPQTEIVFYEPIIMETATKLRGTVYNSDGDNVGEIEWGGGSDKGDTPDAKSGGLWDVWDE